MKTLYRRFYSWLYRWGWALRWRLFGQLPPRENFGRSIDFMLTRDGRLFVTAIDVGLGGMLFAAMLDKTGWPDLLERLKDNPAGTAITYRGMTLKEYIAAMEAGQAKPEFSVDIQSAIWIVCGGAMQQIAVEAAHRLQLRAIVSDRDPECACATLADEFVQVDIYDVPGHIVAADKLKNKYKIWGVFTAGADCEVTVAELAKHLGLPGIDPAAARRCKNKAEMRSLFTTAGLSPLKWEVVSSTAFPSLDVRTYPVMVKAVDNCGSRGVHRVESYDTLKWAVSDAMANSTTGTALLEQVLEGPQQSVEILFLASGECVWLNIVDRPFDGVMELGHVNPTRLSATKQYELYSLVERAAAAVGVQWGVFKADTIWTKDGPRILEVTARLSGGFDCQYSTPKSSGRDFIKAAMLVSLGLPIDLDDLRRKFNKYCAVWAAFPSPGKVTAINTNGVDADVILRVKVGDVIQPYSHCATRPAFVGVVAETYDGAVSKAKAEALKLADGITTE